MKIGKLFLHLLLFSLLGLSLVSCQKKVSEEAIFDPQTKESDIATDNYQKIASVVNRVFMRQNSLVELYFQKNNSDDLINTPSFTDLPLDSIQTTYNLIRYDNGNLMYVAEFPLSESGDWDMVYESFFDKDGNLVAFVRKCSFFTEQCTDCDGIAREKSEYIYNPSHRLIKKTYLLVDGKDKALKASELTFNCRFPYSIETTTEKWLAKHPIKSTTLE